MITIGASTGLYAQAAQADAVTFTAMGLTTDDATPPVSQSYSVLSNRVLPDTITQLLQPDTGFLLVSHIELANQSEDTVRAQLLWGELAGYAVALAPGESAIYDDGAGWVHYDVNGSPLVSQGGAAGSTQWVDLGLIDLVAATMDGPQTLYDMPEGTFLASIRFTDDPDTVPMDSGPILTPDAGPGYMWPAIGTEKSFGWQGFAGLGILPNTFEEGAIRCVSYDSLTLGALDAGYGPYAALDTGTDDRYVLVLSAAAVGPIQIGLIYNVSGGIGTGTRVGAITDWAAVTEYGSQNSNTVATPGIVQTSAILANGTIWQNGGATGVSGADAPDFIGNAGSNVADGDDIIWFDTSSVPPTVGKVHAVAEIITLVAP